MPSPAVLDLACCVARAETVSRKPVDSSNDVYWHTREACVAAAREAGIRVQDLIGALRGTTWMSKEEVLDRSSSLWPSVAHPDVLAREVMES